MPRAALAGFEAAGRAGDHAAAIAAGEALVAAYPHVAALKLRLANALGRAGQRARQIAMLRAAMAAHPREPAIARLLAQVLGRGADGGDEAAAEVLAVWQQASAAMPYDAEVAEALARALGRAEREAEATAAWARAADLAPAAARVQEGFARSLIRLGDDAAAAAVLRHAVEMEPDNAELRQILITVLVRLGERAAARAEAAAALARDPENPVLHKHITRLDRLALSEAGGDAEAAGDRRARRAMLGQDGFYFYESDHVFGQLCGAPPPDAHIAAYRALIDARAAWCAARGIVFRMLIVPERHVIYADKLPGGFAPQAERAAVQLARSHPGLVVYPFAEMLAGRSAGEVCLRQDVHWTDWGAYLGYRALLGSVPALAAEILALSGFTRRRRKRVGDIAIWLDLRTREEADLLIAPDTGMRVVFSTKTFNAGQVDVVTSTGGAGRRLVLMRTSNSTALLPMLAQHFSRIATLAGTSFFPEFVESERPDAVFFELPERYLAAPAGQGLILPRDFLAGGFGRDSGCELPLPGA